LNPRRPTPEDLKSMKIDYFSVRDDFIAWLRSRGLNWSNYVEKELQYLDRFAKPICSIMDLVKMFDGLSESQKRHLKNGLRLLFNFYESQGLVDKELLNQLRKNLPKTNIGIDLKVPSEEEIIHSLRFLMGKRLFPLYNLLLDSGLRVNEGLRLYNGLIDGSIRPEKRNGFHIATLGFFRNTKLAYYGFITDYTLKLIENTGEKMSYEKIIGVIRHLYGEKAVSWKYLRKFSYDKMIELEIPESIADFIQGRTPRKIGAKHYMNLLKQTLLYYPRYADYLKTLREKCYPA